MPLKLRALLDASEVEDLRDAVGQYVLYESALARIEPERTLYLAIRQRSYTEVFEEEIGRMLLERDVIKLIVFDPKTEVIVRWSD